MTTNPQKPNTISGNEEWSRQHDHHGGVLRRYVPLSSITVAKNEASIISDISTLREPQERIHSLKTTYILPSLLEEKDGNSELRDGVKEDKETEGGSLGLPNNRNAKTVPETGRVEEMNSSSSELRATWVRQRCLILKSKIRTDSNNAYQPKRQN